MAGDWIKMRLDLADDPAVVLIAARLDISEDEVVGKLHRLWGWADRHTTDGVAPGITAKWVNRYVCAGFAEAMEVVGWIRFSEAGVEFPSFDKHNGASAKKRGEDAVRQRLSRENRDKGVTGLTRESIPKSFVRHVYERDGYRCVFCGEASSESIEKTRRAKLSVDHLVPTTRGGESKVPNLATACRPCNAEKNDRTPEEWGLLPTFLQDGVKYSAVTGLSHESCDNSVTREEERRDISSLREESGARSRLARPARPDGVTEQTWTDWLRLRKSKRAPVTDTVVEQAAREADKAGVPLQRFLEIWCMRGSQGLQAEWLRADERRPATAGKHAAAAAGIFDTPNAEQGDVIDV